MTMLADQDDEVHFSGVCVKHDYASGVTVLLLDANPHSCGIGTYPKAGEVLTPFSGAPGKRNVRGRRMKKV